MNFSQRPRLKDLISKIEPPNFRGEEYKYTPHAVLADLNLPTYLTTNYDEFLEEALKARDKNLIANIVDGT